MIASTEVVVHLAKHGRNVARVCLSATLIRTNIGCELRTLQNSLIFGLGPLHRKKEKKKKERRGSSPGSLSLTSLASLACLESPLRSSTKGGRRGRGSQRRGGSPRNASAFLGAGPPGSLLFYVSFY
eukprot:TRINITY_DN4277_c0_g1_i3.p1 TRINITY_DN4277_c0_g1~~TRINITY_DN4277_c0_g1_i3.p1  ORF type:complete len:127 (+),score=2.08 TRINITY_DN4277_c0_g1_i3:156-536(+)